MTFRPVFIVLALLPIVLLMSCSTPRTTQQVDTAPQNRPTAERPASTPDEPGETFPRFTRRPEYPESPDSAVFPKPPSLEPQVNFWRDVYANWSRTQVALHDNVYLDVVYEVARLPDPLGEGLSADQKEFVRERMNYWKFRLIALESKMDTRLPLSADEQRLANLLARSEGGRNAIRGASERLRYQRGTRERFKRGLEISGMYDRSFREIFRKAGLPEDLAYLPHVESSFQAHARSSAGALGIWQFTAGAAKMFMNGDDSPRARLDPIASAHGAARYLRYAYGKLGSWPLAVTSYNHGIGGMQRAKNRYGHDFTRIVKDYDHPLFGFASRNYYAEFLAAKEIANRPERYFPEGVQYAADADWTISRLAAESDADEAPRVSQPAARVAAVFPTTATLLNKRNFAAALPAKSLRPAAKPVTKSALTPAKKAVLQAAPAPRQITNPRPTTTVARHTTSPRTTATASRKPTTTRPGTVTTRQALVAKPPAPGVSRKVSGNARTSSGPQKVAARR